MVSFTVRMKFAPEDRAEIERLMHALTPLSREEVGCVSYIPHWVESEPATLVIYEQYVDETALEHHRTTEHFAAHATNGLYLKVLDRHLERLTAFA